MILIWISWSDLESSRLIISLSVCLSVCLPQHGVFLSRVRDTDAVIGVGQGVVEKGVGHDSTGVRKPEQGVVREHRAQPQQAANEQGL